MSRSAKHPNYSDGFNNAADRMTVPVGVSRFRGGYSIKKQLLLRLVVAFGFALIMTVVPVCKAGQSARPNDTDGERRGDDRHRHFVSPAVFQAAGPSAVSIQSTVDAFRAALGNPNNGNAAGPLASGRREINWDGGGVDTTTAPVTPFDVFLNSRGARFTTPGSGLSQAPPSGGPQGGLAAFSAIRPTAPSLAPSARCGCSLQWAATSLKLCFLYLAVTRLLCPAGTRLRQQR